METLLNLDEDIKLKQTTIRIPDQMYTLAKRKGRVLLGANTFNAVIFRLITEFINQDKTTDKAQ